MTAIPGVERQAEVPETGANTAAAEQRLLRSRSTAAASRSPARAGVVFGLFLIAVGVVALANEVLLVDWDVLWPVVLIGLGGLLLLTASSRR
jgi:hypothetical protein